MICLIISCNYETTKLQAVCNVFENLDAIAENPIKSIRINSVFPMNFVQRISFKTRKHIAEQRAANVNAIATTCMHPKVFPIHSIFNALRERTFFTQFFFRMG